MPTPNLHSLFNPTPAVVQAKTHRHVPSIYHNDESRTLRLTMVDILRLFADTPEIGHFDDLRRLNLLAELEARIASYVTAGGSITFGTLNLFALSTPAAFNSVPGALFLRLEQCLKREAA
jgi:hypothetical protein